MGKSQRAPETAGWGFGHYLCATFSALCHKHTLSKKRSKDSNCAESTDRLENIRLCNNKTSIFTSLYEKRKAENVRATIALHRLVDNRLTASEEEHWENKPSSVK